MDEFSFELNTDKRVLLSLVANNLFDSKRSVDTEGVDWSAVWREAYMQTVALVAFSNFDNGVYKFDGFEKIREELSNTLSRNVSVDFEHVHIHNLLTAEKIPYVILKGYSAAAYYPDPLMRSMGDVDFLVAPSDIERAGKVLEANGFRLVKDSHDCHLVYVTDRCRYEMHFEPSGIPYGEKGKKIREYLEDTVESGEEIKTELGTIKVPDKFHHGIIILLHMCHHLTGEGIGLRHLCDWAVFISKFTEEEYLSIFEERLKAVGLWEFAHIITLICAEYLSCPVKVTGTDSDRQIAAQIVEDIFKGGNFGQKNADRSHERLLISSKEEESIDGSSMIKQFFISLNRIVYSNWPAAKKVKLLLPFGWLFFSIRYIIRSLLGKRPRIRPKEVASQAAERRQLYAQLRLFEPDGERSWQSGKRGKKTQKKKYITFAAIVAVLAIVLAVVAVFAGWLGKINGIAHVEPIPAEDEYFETDVFDGSLEELDPDSIEWGEGDYDLGDDHLLNVLLAGQDLEDENGRQRTDTMILCSYNPEKNEVSVISFLRDLYVRLPGYSDNRLNAAYVFGGFPLLKEALDVNFGITVDGCVEIDYDAFRQIINLVGGVDITLTATEAKIIGDGAREGISRLDGDHALMYARLRRIDSDFGRTSRQRNLLNALFEKVKDMSSTDLLVLFNKVLPLVNTDFTKMQLTSLAVKYAPNFSKLDIETYSVPDVGTYKDARISGMAVLVPDVDKIRQLLAEEYLPY